MPRAENRHSVLLSREENEQVFAMIGLKCQSLATAVVQLFTTEGPAHGEWKKRDTGVLCLIKDNQRRSYFFRLYCLHRKCMIWEHEVYIQIEYKNPRPYLHTFEAEEYMTAFNFANEEEARTLRNILIEKIETRKQRREERQKSRMSHSTRSSYGSSGPPPALPAGAAPALSPRYNGAAPPTPYNSHKPASTLPPLTPVVKSSGKKPKPKRFTKADIGMPQDFVHVSHIGWDEQKGFDVENVPEEEMKDFFRMAGVSETQLQDQDTREFIYDFINQHGGLDTVVKEVHDTKHRQLDSQHIGSRAPGPPPVPSRSPAAPAVPGPPTRAPPAPPARAVPPPPPLSAPAPAPPRNPPPPRPSQPPSSGPPIMPPPPPPPMPTGSGGALPPPPPPPPPSDNATSARTPPPHASGLTHAQPDPRAELMNSIRLGGAALKPVDTTKPANIVEDGRNDLLKQIREGTKLKPVERNDTGRQLLANRLAEAIQNRMRVMQESDSEESEPTDSEGEWADE